MSTDEAVAQPSTATGKLKRRHVSIETQLEVIAYAKEHGNRPAARKFAVDESVIRRLAKKGMNLGSLCSAMLHNDYTYQGGSNLGEKSKYVPGHFPEV